MTRATKVYDRGGWRNAVRWTKWSKVGEFDTYRDAAIEANDGKYKTGLRQVAIFFHGKPYRQLRNSSGDLIGFAEGRDAIRASGGGHW
jgi:hypothetical protein